MDLFVLDVDGVMGGRGVGLVLFAAVQGVIRVCYRCLLHVEQK